MNAIILNEPKTLTFRDDYPMPEARVGEVLVRVRRVGICGTDLNSYKGKMPFQEYPRILGHELGVEVVESHGLESTLPAGTLCAVEPYLYCGECHACLSGKTNCCSTLRCLGVHTDGGMCDYLVLPEQNLHPSATLSPDQLALIEMLGIGKHAVDRADPAESEVWAVLGLGPIGLSIVQFAILQEGVRVIVGDIDQNRIDTCLNLLGGEAWKIKPDRSLADDWNDQYGELPQTVFDATGSAKSMEQAFSLPNQGGKIVFVGLTNQAIAFPVAQSHRRELTTLSSRNSTAGDFKAIMSLMETGAINTDPWITHRSSAADFPVLIDEWLKPNSGLVKGILDF